MEIYCNFYQVDESNVRVNEMQFKFDLDGRVTMRKAFFSSAWDYVKRMRMYHKIGAKAVNCRLPLCFEMTRNEQTIDLGRCERKVIERFKYGNTHKAQNRWVRRMWEVADYMINSKFEVIDMEDFGNYMNTIEKEEELAKVN